MSDGIKISQKSGKMIQLLKFSHLINVYNVIDRFMTNKIQQIKKIFINPLKCRLVAG